MKDAIMRAVVIGAVIGAILFGVVSCTRWRWNECRQVGHGKLYCALHMGK